MPATLCRNRAVAPSLGEDEFAGEDALARVADAGAAVPRRELPVFITEYGYGLLAAEAGATVEGRVRIEHMTVERVVAFLRGMGEAAWPEVEPIALAAGKR